MSIITQAMKEGRAFSLYEESEQTDVNMGEEGFDNLWQSLFDVYKLAIYGILEDIDKKELDLLASWLVKYQEYTKVYQNVGIPF